MEAQRKIEDLTSEQIGLELSNQWAALVQAQGNIRVLTDELSKRNQKDQNPDGDT